jgi:hypothetical protein
MAVKIKVLDVIVLMYMYFMCEHVAHVQFDWQEGPFLQIGRILCHRDDHERHRAFCVATFYVCKNISLIIYSSVTLSGMVFQSQFSLSLELTKLVPVSLVASKAAEAIMSLARDLQVRIRAWILALGRILASTGP